MFIRIPLLVFAALLLLPIQAQAHKIHVFAWVSGDIVTVEANFSEKRPLLHAKVTVKDKKSESVLLQGTGDEKGIFTFPVPAEAKKAALDLLIVVTGSEGHQNTWIVPAQEYLAGVSEEPAETTVVEQTATVSNTPKTVPNNDELKAMLEELLTRELAPIRRSLAKAEEKKLKFSDIMGGIGYLLGLAGIVTWYRNRPGKTGHKDA